MAVNNSRLLASQLQKEWLYPPRDSYRNPVSTLIGRQGHLATPRTIAVTKGTGHTDWLSPFAPSRAGEGQWGRMGDAPPGA